MQPVFGGKTFALAVRFRLHGAKMCPKTKHELHFVPLICVGFSRFVRTQIAKQTLTYELTFTGGTNIKYRDGSAAAINIPYTRNRNSPYIRHHGRAIAAAAATTTFIV